MAIGRRNTRDKLNLRLRRVQTYGRKPQAARLRAASGYPCGSHGCNILEHLAAFAHHHEHEHAACKELFPLSALKRVGFERPSHVASFHAPLCMHFLLSKLVAHRTTC